MEIPLGQGGKPGASQDSRKSFKKFVLVFIIILLVVFIFLIFLTPLLAKYQAQQKYENAQKVADEMKKYEDQQYQLALKDTYGGKTPQETLRMYIDAVEKGDYQLASKYFILDKQNKILEDLNTSNVSESITKSYVNALRDALGRGGKLSMDGKQFSFNGEILVQMILYPSGVWKIVEI